MFSDIASPCVTAAGDLENRTADDLCMIDGTGTVMAIGTVLSGTVLVAEPISYPWM